MDGWTDAAKTISLRLRGGIKKWGEPGFEPAWEKYIGLGDLGVIDHATGALLSILILSKIKYVSWCIYLLIRPTHSEWFHEIYKKK